MNIHHHFLFFLYERQPHKTTLFPYTTLFRSQNGRSLNELNRGQSGLETYGLFSNLTHDFLQDRKSGSAGMPRPSSYAVFCLKKKIRGFRIIIYNSKITIYNNKEQLITTGKNR